jgi:hypothetical protein
MATSKGNGKISKSNGKAQREERLQIMLAPAELSAVDNFRFGQRMPSRAAAVRELIRLGLASVDSLVAQPGSHSREYGVLNTPQRDGDAS